MSNCDQNACLVVVLIAMFFPSVTAVIRGRRDNHMGGIVLMNLMMAVALGASSYLDLAAIATLPACGLVFFGLLACAFIAPGASCRSEFRCSASRDRRGHRRQVICTSRPTRAATRPASSGGQ
jgi:energy-converting hydrogenase Eha subunit C